MANNNENKAVEAEKKKDEKENQEKQGKEKLPKEFWIALGTVAGATVTAVGAVTCVAIKAHMGNKALELEQQGISPSGVGKDLLKESYTGK